MIVSVFIEENKQFSQKKATLYIFMQGKEDYFLINGAIYIFMSTKFSINI
jgi:hypothetical protein